jgi:hypothetical protein
MSRGPERSTTGASGGRSDEGARQGVRDRPSGADRKRDTTGRREDSRNADRQRDKGKAARQPSRDSTSQRPNERRSTTGQAPADSRSGRSEDRDRTRTNRDERDERTDRTNRDDRMDRERGNRDDRMDRERAGRDDGDRRDDRAAGPRRGERTGARQEGSVRLTQEQRSRITEVISKQRTRAVTNVNFSVSIGTTVPRSVRLHDLPREIVTIYPQFRGYRYVVVQDEIVIVEPRSSRIVEVISHSGRTTTGTTTRESSSKLRLSDDKRRKIREVVVTERPSARCEEVSVTVGTEIPGSIALLAFPDIVIRDVPEIREYRYCVRGDDVVLIDPDDHRIVEVIE